MMGQFEETHIGELCEKIKKWKHNHKEYPTRKELVSALEELDWVDVDKVIDEAISAGVAEEIHSRITLTEGA